MPPKRNLTFFPFAAQEFNDRCLLAELDEPQLTLGQLLRDLPALCAQPLEAAYLDLLVANLTIHVQEPTPGTSLYLPPGLNLPGFDSAGPAAASKPESVVAVVVELGPAEDGHPERLSEREAVLIAHAHEINQAASYLESGLSVLIRCEKLLVEHLAQEIASRSGRPQRRIQLPGGRGGAAPPPMMGGSRRSELMAALEQSVAQAVPGDLVVVPQLDLLAGGSDASLSGEARELTDLLYEHSDRVILAFTDPSLVIPEVLANRFAVRLAMDILPREVVSADGSRVPIGRALVTRQEAALFSDFDPVTLYKHIAGMNAVRLRHGMIFAHHQHREDAKPPTFAGLLHELRTFKARTSSAFEVPNVPLEAIGGYDEVKAELQKALEIISGAATAEYGLPEQLRHDLVPRGFIFHGPPGTGKTLFAKAIASRLDATILVVSGPEITDMYVGESERKLRDLFAEARRNAPAVLVFDEFDSIAGKRTGRDDGGSRAGNAIVAQLLTELDGFRPEVPVLIIGTTNRIDIIDDALLRPSRFRSIKIDLPDESARRAIARVHADHFGVPVGDDLRDAIARATLGMNGDEIRSIFRDARADELVGRRRKPDARRLGELIGELRRSQQQRDIDKEQQIGQPGTMAGNRRRPMVVLSARSVPTEAVGPIEVSAEEEPS